MLQSRSWHNERIFPNVSGDDQNSN